MKYFLMIITVLYSISSLAARHKIFKRYAYIVKRADSIVVYRIDAIPVEKKSQDSKKRYMAEYPVLNTVVITNEQKAALKKAVFLKGTYLDSSIKRCPFEGKYAAVFTRGKKNITLIISSSACSKVQVYLPGQPFVALPYDLADSNGIEKALN